MKWTAEERRKAVRIVRHAANLTQVELGQKAKVDSTKLSLYESGHVDLTPDELRRVERVLDKTARTGKKVPLASLADPKYLLARNQERARKLRRRQVGMSQRQLCRAARISRTTLSKWENGQVELSPEEKARWDQALREGNPLWEPLKEVWEAAQKKLRQLEEVTRSQDSLIQSQHALIATERALIEELLGRIAELEADDQVTKEQLKALREWLNSEQVAALAHEDAEKNRENVHQMALDTMSEEKQ